MAAFALFVVLLECKRVIAEFQKRINRVKLYAQLKFVVLRVEAVTNKRLESEFLAARADLVDKGHDASVLVAYHGTKLHAIPSVLENNALIVDVDDVDQELVSWYANGAAFSDSPVFVMHHFVYGSDEMRPVRAGDSCKLIQFDILPGRVNIVKRSFTRGAPRVKGTDSNRSRCQRVLFESRYMCPRFVISFQVREKADAVTAGTQQATTTAHHQPNTVASFLLHTPDIPQAAASSSVHENNRQQQEEEVGDRDWGDEDNNA